MGIAPVLLGITACATQNVAAATRPITATAKPDVKPTKPAIALPNGPVAPVIKSDTWINTKPLAWDSLRGKVVMVEFWTFG